MKQLGLWEDIHVPEENKQIEKAVFELFVDGASKHNPGPAGAGFVIMKNKEIICRQGFYLGKKTNNQAEYYGLLIGIFFLKKYIQKNDSFTIVSDSQLLVRQMNGEYKVRDAQLKMLKDLIVLWLQEYSYKVVHVLREYNRFADEMANRGVEQKIFVPQEILQILKNHDITL